MSIYQNELLQRMRDLLDEYDADELLVNGRRGTFVTKCANIQKVDFQLSDFDAFADFVRDLAWSQGLRLDPFHPASGGVIDHLSLRWHAVVSPVAFDEIVFSLRRHRFEALGLERFQIPSSHQIRLNAALDALKPLLVVGPTGVGKTSFLVSILKARYATRRVVIAESIAEIPALSPYWLRLTVAIEQSSGKGAFSMEQVMRESLRLRPEVLVVGELRGNEAEWYLDMSLSGHGGCLATIHAGHADAAWIRLQAMAPRSCRSLPEDFSIVMVTLARTSEGLVEVIDVSERGPKKSKYNSQRHLLEHDREGCVQ